MRRIDQGAACAGCGDAGPWLWTCTWLWSWLWEWEPVMEKRYIITLLVSTEAISGHSRPYGRPIAIAMAAARNGNGSETAARNQTKRDGMNGISHSSSR